MKIVDAVKKGMQVTMVGYNNVRFSIDNVDISITDVYRADRKHRLGCAINDHMGKEIYFERDDCDMRSALECCIHRLKETKALTIE